MSKPKILLLDLETSPKRAFVWGRWKVNVAMNQLISDTYLLTWAAKWLGDETVYYDALYLHKKHYAKDPECDRQIVDTLWDMINEADIIIAHNGDRFDIPVMNGRFLAHNMVPPATYQSVDTLKIARRCFRLTSNRLDDLGDYLNVGRKIDTGGFELWRDVLNGDRKAFKHMLDYNIQDVDLLEAVYLKLRGWDKRHPSTAMLNDPDNPECNVCGSTAIIKNGSHTLSTGIYQKYKCKDCGCNLRSRKKTQTRHTLVSI
jgi:DNA polymerase elongation subunit (family B)